MDSNPRFTVLPKSCLDAWVESVGLSKLSDDVGDSLAEDTTYRLREAVHNALRIMKHSKRKCLTVEDMNLGLQQSNTELVYGHGGLDNITFKGLPFKDSTVAYVEEKEVNLRETALEPTYPADSGVTTVKASWLVLEGHKCSSGTKKDDMNQKDQLTEPCLSYLKNITSAIIGSGEYLRKVALQDISSNKKLQGILPHLISFFSTQIKHHTDKPSFSKTSDLILMAVRALVENSSLLLTPYIFQLVKIMLFIVIEAQTPVENWDTKARAAVVLAHLCSKHMNTLSYLPHQLLKPYQENLNDMSKPLSHVYGSIVGITTLGPEAIFHVLYPVLKKRLEHLESALMNSSNDKDVEIRTSHEVLAVRTAIADALTVFLKSSQADKSSQTQINLSQDAPRDFNNIYCEVYEELGERFLNRCVFSGAQRKKTQTLDSNQNLSATGSNSTSTTNMHSKTISDKVKELIQQKLETLRAENKQITTPNTIRRHLLDSHMGPIYYSLTFKRKLSITPMPSLLEQDSIPSKRGFCGSSRKKMKMSPVTNVKKKSRGFHLSYQKSRKEKLVADLLSTPVSLPLL